MDLRDLVKLAGIVNPELLNRIDATPEVEEADGGKFELATTAPDEQVMDDPMQSMGSDVDTSLRRYLKARGDHVTVDEEVYPDHTVDSVSEAYASFKAEGSYGKKKTYNEATKGCADCEYMKDETDGDIDTCDECAAEERAKANQSAVEEGAEDRARYDADETPRGEKKKKVSLKKAPWEKDDDDKVDESKVEEDDIDENAFNQAAAAASRAGKDSFEFGGKTHKTTMKKDTAHKLDDDVDMLRKLAGIDESKMSDQLIHDSETMSKEEFTKKYGKEVADEYFESNESLNYLKKLSGL